MRKSALLFVVLTFFLLQACEDPISIDLPSGSTYLVVEGWITDQPGPYRVRLSQTLPFDSPETNPKISDAKVYITSKGVNYFLTENPETPGEYLTDSAEFVGTPGVNYKLVIEWDDKVIISTENSFKAAPPIDTLTYSFVPNIFVPETLSFTSGYLVTGFVSDPATENDYYRWKVSENGISYDRAEDLILITDRFFNGKKFGFELSSLLFQVDDTVTVSQYTIDAAAFEYLKNLNTQAIGLGKSTSTPPSLVRGNLKYLSDDGGVILGYFGMSSVSSAKVIIKKNQ
tara:strand:+ start:350 stop:1207 length:858 start_codon:yes stop_codon:yes gene_type:complete